MKKNLKTIPDKKKIDSLVNMLKASINKGVNLDSNMVNDNYIFFPKYFFK